VVGAVLLFYQVAGNFYVKAPCDLPFSEQGAAAELDVAQDGRPVWARDELAAPDVAERRVGLRDASVVRDVE
jgi:hypothetical protein